MRRPKLGQHFLRDVRYAERAVQAAGLTHDDVVLEVGPGRGVLTRLLAPACARVVAVELDPELADALLPRLAEEGITNVELVRGDAVTAPLPPFTACVSNLPYQISSPFLFRLLEQDFRIAILLVQREFAARLAAKPGGGDYGRLTVSAARRAEVRILTRVPPGAFAPPPRVESALVEVRPRPPSYDVPDAALFDEVVLKAFTQRRKKLTNALASLPPPLRAAVAASPHAEKRAEELAPEDFAHLVQALVEARP